VYGPVRTVVWQGSAGDRRPYADQRPNRDYGSSSLSSRSQERFDEYNKVDRLESKAKRSCKSGRFGVDVHQDCENEISHQSGRTPLVSAEGVFIPDLAFQEGVLSSVTFGKSLGIPHLPPTRRCRLSPRSGEGQACSSPQYVGMS